MTPLRLFSRRRTTLTHKSKHPKSRLIFLTVSSEVAMLEIKSELEAKISNFFKENMIMSILDFLKFSKENLW